MRSSRKTRQMSPEDEKKLGRCWIAKEREWHRKGLRPKLPGDVRAGRDDPSYLISSFKDVYGYILRRPGCTYHDLKNDLSLSSPVIINNIAVLKKRGIVTGKAIGSRRVMKFYIKNKINVGDLVNGKKD